MSYTVLRTCPSCGAGNRVPAKHLADAGRCGNCKAPLPPIAAPIEADSTSFDQIVREARVPVLVDFWAAWCGPCRMAAPEVEALAREMAGGLIVLKVDTEQNQELAARFRVQSIPMFAVFQDGKMALQRAGAAPRSEMRRWVEQAAAGAPPETQTAR